MVLTWEKYCILSCVKMQQSIVDAMILHRFVICSGIQRSSLVFRISGILSRSHLVFPGITGMQSNKAVHRFYSILRGFLVSDAQQKRTASSFSRISVVSAWYRTTFFWLYITICIHCMCLPVLSAQLLFSLGVGNASHASSCQQLSRDTWKFLECYGSMGTCKGSKIHM